SKTTVRSVLRRMRVRVFVRRSWSYFDRCLDQESPSSERSTSSAAIIDASTECGHKKAHKEHTKGSLSVFQIHCAGFGIKIQSLWSLFAHAVTRFLCSTERQLILNTRGRKIHGNQSRLDAIDELMHARQVLRDDRS